MESILGKVLCIENILGDTIMAVEVDDNGHIKQYKNCNIADVDNDYEFFTSKPMIRLQQEELI